MAFSVKVIGISKDTGKPLLEMELPWWDTNQLREDERFVESNDTGSYRDYDADLSVEEISEIHEKYRQKASTGGYEYSKWQEIIQPMIRELDEAIYSQSEQYSHFHVRVFEWESGLD